eukprot:CAMPEP_0171497676 /NCGR_PEP_ID=MMETSP0958-20121227/7408_1 /TAXON_ID=87120 /ORGANISM="Aurantiochytrium limacinum, Strain ATCCMYA-1381" /LENGTH=142 /DNA_ID=CAMNT_0012031953 /DNA_START=59 /DNA_END=488 /DNA_ORIENTATION=-
MEAVEVRHVLQAGPVLLVLAVTLVVEVLAFATKRWVIELRPSKEEIELQQDVARLEAEAKEYNLPSTFMKWAKLRRQAASREREVLKLAEARKIQAQASWRKRASQVLGFRQQVLWAALYFVYQSSLPPVPLLEEKAAGFGQ